MSEKQCRLRRQLCNYLLNCLENGIDDDGEFDFQIRQAVQIIQKICDYIETHGNITLSCGSEWMYQDDDGQVDALSLVGKILDSLERYSEDEENE